MGESFRIDNTINYIYCSSGQIVKSVIYLYGATWFLLIVGKLISVISSIEIIENDNTIIVNLENRYLFWVIIIFMFWLPGIILSYPATSCHDAWGELAQYFGYTPFTSHHPPFFTILIGSIVELGQMMGDVNIGFLLLRYFIWYTIMMKCRI